MSTSEYSGREYLLETLATPRIQVFFSFHLDLIVDIYHFFSLGMKLWGFSITYAESGNVSAFQEKDNVKPKSLLYIMNYSKKEHSLFQIKTLINGNQHQVLKGSLKEM